MYYDTQSKDAKCWSYTGEMKWQAESLPLAPPHVPAVHSIFSLLFVLITEGRGDTYVGTSFQWGWGLQGGCKILWETPNLGGG